MDQQNAMTPALTEAEQQLLRAAAVGRASALEFGCGGSTPLLLAAGVGRLLSVDSDPAWLRKVAAWPSCAAALEAKALTLLHIDIGPTGAWGWPQDSGRAPFWPAYWREPWEAAREADFVFVDGRFRVACALNSVARLPQGGVLLLHDYWDRTAYHAPLLRHFDMLGSAGSLVLLAPKQPVDAALLAADLVAYAMDPR